MTEEIKEILDYIDDRIIPNEKWDKIKDYITNLQQENKAKTHQIEVLEEIVNYENIRNDKLQQEKERLKTKYNKLEEEYSRLVLESEEFYNLSKDYKSRCEKAIELYKNCKEEDYCILSINMYEVLNGSDDK